jgi:hypothetical protein
MALFYEEPGLQIYNADSLVEAASLAEVEAIITDPVWPNSVFPNVREPEKLFREVLHALPASVERIVVQLGCDSDPRFLRAVPERFSFFRFCSLEYAQVGYKGRLLQTGDVAYVFGSAPDSKPGAHLMPGRVLATGRGRFEARRTGMNREGGDYKQMHHPCARDLEHVQWLVKWFGGESVCDPFMGTGTTGLACKRLGVRFVGIEIEKDYCELAVDRLRQEVFNFHNT